MRTDAIGGAWVVAGLLLLAPSGRAGGEEDAAAEHGVSGMEAPAEASPDAGDNATVDVDPAIPGEAATTTTPETARDEAVSSTVPLREVDGPEAPRADPSPGLLSVGLPAEVTVVGLTVGVRPELIVRPLAFATWLELRGAVGLLAGLEYGYTPLSLGVRGRYLGGAWHPMAGIAVTEEFFWITDASPIVRTVMELDLGGSVDLSDDWAVDLVAYTGWAFAGEPGPMAGLRLGVRYDLDLD